MIHPPSMLSPLFAGCFISTASRNIEKGDPIESYGFSSFKFMPGCCQDLKSNVNGSRIFYYPLDWLPEDWRNEESIKRVVKFFADMGASLDFLGIYSNPKMEPKIDVMNTVAFRYSYNNPNEVPSMIIYENKWVALHQKEYLSSLYNYYVFCLVRHLFGWKWSYMIRDALKVVENSQIPAFEAFQIAHYAYPVKWNGSKGFMCNYVGNKLLSFEKFKRDIISQSSLNALFTQQPAQNTNYNEIQSLFENGKYDDIRELLGG